MAFSILFKANGLLALGLLSFCSMREQRSEREKHWQTGAQGVRKIGDELGEGDASVKRCRAGARSAGRGLNMGNGSIEYTYCQVIVPQ